MAWDRVNSAATASTYCPNRGYYELASGVEIVSYFDKLMQERFLPSARVQYLTFRRKAPTNTWTAGAVELVDVHRGAVVNPVSLSAMAAGDLKTAFRVILRELLRR